MMKEAPIGSFGNLRDGSLRINNLIIKFLTKQNHGCEFFFICPKAIGASVPTGWKTGFRFARSKIGNSGNAFLAESFFSQGYELIPIIIGVFKTLKKFLKAAYSPPVSTLRATKNTWRKSIAMWIKRCFWNRVKVYWQYRNLREWV